MQIITMACFTIFRLCSSILGYLAGRDVRWAIIIVGIAKLCYRFIDFNKIRDGFKKGDIFFIFAWHYFHQYSSNSRML